MLEQKTALCDVAVIGAGPYGLSLAAHLRTRGINFRVFGKALDTWRAHMPESMMLKSEGFASNLGAPDRQSTLKSYCAEHGIAYADRSLPIKLSDFIAYADWFRARHVPNLEETQVLSVRRSAKRFILELETGEIVTAKKVVLAVGVTWYHHTPPELARLGPGMVSHSYDHRTVDQFKGREIVVLGAGASAINLAHELEQAGCSVRLLARRKQIEYNEPPSPKAKSFWYRLKNPPSPIGQGWRSYFCARLPNVFYLLPASLRARAVNSHVHAAGGWYMREKVEGRVPSIRDCHIQNAEPSGGRIALRLADSAGRQTVLACDHVIAATGYQVDIRRLTFLAKDLQDGVLGENAAASVSAHFQTKVPGLYAVGMTAMQNFGPLLRFMVGTHFTSAHLARHLHRRCALEKLVKPLGRITHAFVMDLKLRSARWSKA